LAVVSERNERLIEIALVHALLDQVPDIALVDELVLLRDFLHDFQNELLAVARVLVEARVER